jgi:hypothetical protein
MRRNVGVRKLTPTYAGYRKSSPDRETNVIASIRRGMLLLPILLLATAVRADPVTLDVGKFSDRYYVKVVGGREDEERGVKLGVVQVYDRKRPGKPIITLESAAFGVDDEEVVDEVVDANMHEFPYGEHSSLIYEDFNFDGEKDLAIMDGSYSCYNGPSFQVYLADGKGGFAHNPEFTRLAQDYCGFFDIDTEAKTINVMTKSGYAWHRYERYKVNGKHLRLIHSLTDDGSMSRNFSGVTIIEVGAKGKKTTIRYTLNEKTNPIVLQFSLKSAPHKEIVLFLGYDADYALLNGKNEENVEVEYSYELAVKGVMPPGKYRDSSDSILTLDAENNSLCFGFGDTTYTVVDQPERLGVQVKQGQRITFLVGDPDTRMGDLMEIHTANNVKSGACPLK